MSRMHMKHIETTVEMREMMGMMKKDDEDDDDR